MTDQSNHCTSAQSGETNDAFLGLLTKVWMSGCLQGAQMTQKQVYHSEAHHNMGDNFLNLQC